MNIPELQDELLRLEYPFLLPDHDPDIERYYYLRSAGRSRDALGIYKSRLLTRYPDDEFRTYLMRSYRSRDPVFKALLARAYRTLGERCLERTRRIILYIADKAESYNPRDVYATLRAVEALLKVLPPDPYEAVAGVERYHRYALALGLKEKSVARAVDLVRAYLLQSLPVVEEERRRREERRFREMERERKRLVKEDWASYLKPQTPVSREPMLDLSRVSFSAADLRRVEIPGNLVKIEDQTLAYCIKYWNLTEDSAFERILYLYSRKYNAKNYDVYMTIRRGRQNKKRDDEILASVMSSLVTGYYYSIQGDKYLQRRWNALKGALQPRPSSSPAAPPPAAPAKPLPARPAKPGSAAARPRPAPPPPAKPRSARPAKPGPSGAKPRPAPPPPAAPAPLLKNAPPEPRILKPVKFAPGQAAPPAPVLRPAAPPDQAAPAIKPAAAGLPRAADTPGAGAPGRPSGGSVADRLRELSGRSYDLFQERFLANARPAIRKTLSAGRGLFFSPPERAEDLIYQFLRTHYADPYMNWGESEEKTALAALGFDLDSLTPIIDECYGRL
jgi:hypothetical protein